MIRRISLPLILCLLGACGAPPARVASADGAPAKSAETPNAEEGESAPVGESHTASGDTVQVRLVKPGAEPRSKLRLKLVPGSTETMVMVMRMRTSTAIGEGFTSSLLPDMVEHLRMNVTEVNPDGRARIDFVIEKANAKQARGVDAAVVSAVDTALQGMVGMRGYTMLTDRGVVEAGDVEVPPDATPTLKQMATQMRESITQFASPVPEEPVGVGAVWEVTTHPIAGGVKVTQKATQTLVSRQGPNLKTSAVVASTAAPQEMKNDKLPPGARADVQSLHVTGNGSSVWSLVHMVPDHSQVKVHSKLDALLTVGKDSLPMKAEAEIEIGLTRAP